MTYKRQDVAFKRKLCERADELRREQLTEDLARILEELRAENFRKGRKVFPFKHFGDRVEDKR